MVPTLFVIGAIILFLSAVHSCYNGGRIARAAQSNDPEVRKDAEQSIKIIVFIGLLCFLYFLWPLLLIIAVFYIIGIFFKVIFGG